MRDDRRVASTRADLLLAQHDDRETAARAQTPAPKSVRTDDDKTRSSNATLTYTLKVKNADDTVSTVSCTVERTNDTPTLN
mgnify:CR=1 FL=1